MHTADKGVYRCAVTRSCQSSTNSNTAGEQPLFRQRAARNGSSGTTTPGAGQTQERSCACPSRSAWGGPSRRSNLQSPAAEEGEWHGEWFVFSFSKEIWCRICVSHYSPHSTLITPMMHSSRAGLSILTGHSSQVGYPKWDVLKNVQM